MASFKFSVPPYPTFQRDLTTVERHHHNQYMIGFRQYATTVLRAQTMVAQSSIDKNTISADIDNLKRVANDFTAKASAVLEFSTDAVEEEIRGVKKAVADEVAKFMASVAKDTEVVDREMVSELKRAREGFEGFVRKAADVSAHQAPVERSPAPSLSVGTSVSGSEAPSVQHTVQNVGASTLANRAKRQKAKARRQRKREGVSVGVSCESEADVPEWRRKGGVGAHVGVFQGCSGAVQTELRDTRAKMLVEKNLTASVRAKVERAQMEARLKSRVYELEVETVRHKLDSDREKFIKARLDTLPKGYAETVLSEGIPSCVPSLSSGSVSPNSSISVAEVNKLFKDLEGLTIRVAEVTAEAQEERIKFMARISVQDEELKRLLAANSRRDEIRGGNDGYSSWTVPGGF